jgi:hypothetical protein
MLGGGEPPWNGLTQAYGIALAMQLEANPWYESSGVPT